MNRPDALFIPFSSLPNLPTLSRNHHVIGVAEPLLGIDPESDEEAWARTQDNGYFVTRDPADTMLFPLSHKLAERERYHWKTRSDGIRIGVLRCAD